jgi:hypothetical protein
MEYDKNKYKELYGKFLLFLWNFNPVAFISELILGQRTPKIILEDISIRILPVLKDATFLVRIAIPTMIAGYGQRKLRLGIGLGFIVLVAERSFLAF